MCLTSKLCIESRTHFDTPFHPFTCATFASFDYNPYHAQKMMSPHSDPITLSNIAVKCMQNGDIRDANILLNSALRLLVVIDRTASSSKSAPSIRFSWSQHAAIVRNGSSEIENIGAFMYSRGAVLDVSHQPKFDLGPKSEERAVILYNAALAAHLLAHMTAKSAMMNRAKSLYILSQHVLRSRRETGVNSSLCNKHFFHIAILNNLGQINYELAEFALAKKYFANTKHIFQCMAASRRSEENQIYCMSDLKGMRQNAIMEMPTAAACA